MSQGSTPDPLLFNILINGMLFFVSKFDICNLPDDDTLSSCGKVLRNILHNLKFDIEYILKWFMLNSLKPNPARFQLIILGKDTNIKVNLVLLICKL